MKVKQHLTLEDRVFLKMQGFTSYVPDTYYKYYNQDEVGELGIIINPCENCGKGKCILSYFNDSLSGQKELDVTADITQLYEDLEKLIDFGILVKE